MLKHCIYFGGYFVTAWPFRLSYILLWLILSCRLSSGSYFSLLFFIYFYFSLLFLKNAILYLRFLSQVSFARKNPEIFPHSHRPRGFNKLSNEFFREHTHCKTSHFFIFKPKGLSVYLELLPQLLSC